MAGAKPATNPGDYTFPATQGTVSGVVGIGLVVLLVVIIAVDGWGLSGLRAQLVLLVFGVLTWALMLWPKVLVRGDRLVLRNPFSQTSLPLFLVDGVEVRSVTKAYVGAKTYVGIAVGRKTRALVRPTTFGSPGGPFGLAGAGQAPGAKNADLVEDWVNRAAADARRDAKRTGPPADADIRRTPNLPLFAVLGLLVLAFVVTLFL